jgi:hypothetical protein
MELVLRGDGTISGAKLISDNIVGTAEIDDGEVTTAKLQNRNKHHD